MILRTVVRVSTQSLELINQVVSWEFKKEGRFGGLFLFFVRVVVYDISSPPLL